MLAARRCALRCGLAPLPCCKGFPGPATNLLCCHCVRGISAAPSAAAKEDVEEEEDVDATEINNAVGCSTALPVRSWRAPVASC